MKKVLYTATVASHICQFHLPYLKMLKEQGYEICVAAHDNLAEKNGLQLKYVDKFIEVPFSRSPKSPQNIKAYKQLKALFNEEFYDLIVCNTPMGGIVTRLAAKKTRKKGTKVIYIAHGFHFYKGGPKKNWLFYYPIEKHFAKYTDILVTINKMDYQLAQRKFRAKEVEYIPGIGVNLKQFSIQDQEKDIREDLLLSKDSKLILSVGELNDNKNHQAIIRALTKVADSNVHYLIAGNGPNLGKLQKLANRLGVADNVHFLGYRRDLPYIYKSADIFVLPSYREGLGMAAIEAMHFGLPIITSNRHGINDYSIPDVTGYKYAPNDYNGFAAGIRRILYNEDLKKSMSENNRREAEKFALEASLQRMEEIYQKIMER